MRTCLYANDMSFGRVGRNRYTFVLQECQVGLVEENCLQSTCVIGLVALNAVCPNGRAATCIEHPVLKSGEIRICGHFAAECIDFENEMRFCQTSNRGVARHAPQVGEGLGDKKRVTAKP